MRFQELDWRQTPMGAISLRRRVEPTLKTEVYEVKLDDEYLMSSLFTFGETELARIGLAALGDGPLDVVVGGLGLGFTALAVLADPRVTSLTVIEAHADVIGWHQRHLLPFALPVADDPRCRLDQGDFFARAQSADGLDPATPGRRYDAILVDIDHTPTNLLDPSHASFYSPAGLTNLVRFLQPGGVFGLWSDDAPSDAFLATLRTVFPTVAGHIATFPNPLAGGTSTNGVYVATTS